MAWDCLVKFGLSTKNLKKSFTFIWHYLANVKCYILEDFFWNFVCFSKSPSFNSQVLYLVTKNGNQQIISRHMMVWVLNAFSLHNYQVVAHLKYLTITLLHTSNFRFVSINLTVVDLFCIILILWSISFDQFHLFRVF